MIAVFHALARTVKRSSPDRRTEKHGFSVDGGQIALRAEAPLLTAIKRVRQPTHIYVLDKKAFTWKSEMEWQTKKSIAPIAVVFVNGRDLSELLDANVTLTPLEES